MLVVNDLDPAIYAFWRSVVHEPDAFARLTQDAVLSVDEWRRQHSIYVSTPRTDFLRLGFAAFYMNRTNHSGALNGGPIGGLDQSGTYKIDARFNKRELLERLRLIALYAKQITVLNEDGRDTIERYVGEPRTLVYADPPYFEKSRSLYMNPFTSADHESLASCLNSHSTSHWVLTYDNVPDVGRLYLDRRRVNYTLFYSARHVGKATEIMVLSDALDAPWDLARSA